MNQNTTLNIYTYNLTELPINVNCNLVC